jgi:hypothetical protein
MVPSYSVCEDLTIAIEKILEITDPKAGNHPVEVCAMRGSGPTAYVVRVEVSRGPLLAEQLSRITGQIFFSWSPSFVLFDDNIASILNAAEKGDSKGIPPPMY